MKIRPQSIARITHIILMLSAICMTSCVFPSIQDPVPVYVLDFEKNFFVKGTKNFDVQTENIGDWKNPPVLIEDVEGKYICTDLKTYLTKIKPYLKEASQALEDF